MRRKQWLKKVLLAAMLFAADSPGVLASPSPSPAGHPANDRLARGSFDAVYLRDCGAFAHREPCELSGDLDGDGRPDRVFKIRARKGGAVGIAVAWADGRYSVLGAGARIRRVRTEVYLDGTKDEEVRTEPLDLDGIKTWTLLPPAHGGFAVRQSNSGSTYLAPSVVGHGIFFSGTDAAEMLYWDGSRWRWLILGF